MSYVKQLAVLNFITFVFAFMISMLGQTNAIGGYDMAEISAKYESGITPAGFTFSIWSIIYLALFVMTIFHLVNAFKKSEDYITNRELKLIGLTFAINQLAISVWVYSWLNDMPGISLALLLVQFFTLYVIDRRLQLLNPKKGKVSLFITQMPISIYFGWITIATLANFAAWLVSLGWLANMTTNLYVSYVLLMIAAAIGVVVVYFKHNIFYGLVVLWAIFGVIMRLFEKSEAFYHSLVYLGAFGMILILLAIIKTAVSYTAIREKPYWEKRKRLHYNKFKNTTEP